MYADDIRLISKTIAKENRNRGLTKASNSWFLTNRRMRSICISS